MNNLDKYFENTEKETRDEIAKLFETNLTDIDILAKLNNGELIFPSDLRENVSLEIVYKIIDSPRVNEMLEVIEFLSDYINIDLIDEEHLKKLLHLSINNNLKTFFIHASYSQKLLELIFTEKKFYITTNNKDINVLNYFYKFNPNFIEKNINLIINFLNEDKNNTSIIDSINVNFFKDLFNNSHFREYLNSLTNTTLIEIYMDALNNFILYEKDIDLIKYFFSLFQKHEFYNLLVLSDKDCLNLCIENNYLEALSYFKFSAFESKNLQVLYEKLGLEKFLAVDAIYYNITEVLDEIKINSVPEYIKFFDEVMKYNYSYVNSHNIAFALKLIIKWDKSNFESNSILEKRNYLISRIKNQYAMDIGNREKTELLIDKILAGERKAQPYNITANEERIDFILKFGDINTYEDFDFSHLIPSHILEKTNPKHIKEIISLLEKKAQGKQVKGMGEQIEHPLYELAFKIYLTLGYQRTKDLLCDNLDKSYGNISITSLVDIFKDIDISNVTFQKDGKGFIPVLNNEAINLIFGESYKVKNTPIRNYLRDYEEKEQEINKIIEEIKRNQDLTEEEKVKKEEDINQELSNYKSEINRLFVFYIHYFSQIFNEWDIISEEFLKVQNKSKLKTKLNIHQIENIIEYIDKIRRIPELGIEDEPLAQSDIFDYVGRDVQFTANPEQAPKRAIEISRNMTNINAKKFPNINITDADYSLSVFHPQDRNILSAGYKTGCCFRPNGNADNLGSDGSLLQYCTATEYGGGIEIKDKDGKLVMFSPVLRNGNVLMIHSIEAPYENLPIKLSNRIHKLLKQYAEETIKESQKVGDNIDFVMITDLHHLNEAYIEGDVPLDYKFKVYDKNYEYNKMYNNLDTNHKIIAHNHEKKLDDISYGKVDYSYSYPNLKRQYYITIGKKDLENIKQLEILRQNIVNLTNARSKQKDYELLEQIKEKKQEYLKIYKSILESRKGIDIFAEYKKGMQVIENINKKLNISVMENDISEINYGVDWYIAVTFDGKVIANALESGKKDLEDNLRKFKELRRLEIPFLEIESELPIKTK